MVVYTNADFISLNEENLTYSVLVEDKGKIAYIGYNTPLCYRDAKVVDLEGKAVTAGIAFGAVFGTAAVFAAVVLLIHYKKKKQGKS